MALVSGASKIYRTLNSSFAPNFSATNLDVVLSRCHIYWYYLFYTANLSLDRTNRPDIVLLDFKIKSLYFVKLSGPAEMNIPLKEIEIRSKYHDLLSELEKLNTGYKVKVAVLILAALRGF